MRVRGPILVLVLVANTAAGCFGEARENPDEHLYRNARVWTADPASPSADAFVVKEGRFAFVGTYEGARAAFPNAREFDLAGRFVTPGLVDSHSHFGRVAAAWKCDRDTPRYDPAFDNSDLGQIEVEISRLQRAQYHYQTNATGKTPVDDVATIQDREGAKKGFVCASALANAMGLTANVEAGILSWDFYQLLRELEREGKATMRHHLYLTPPLLDKAIEDGIRTGTGSDLVRIAGIKFYSDGWLGPRTSALLAPYNDRPLSRGVLFLEQAEADAWIAKAHKAGLKPATHAIGDQGVNVVLNAYEKQPDAATARFTIEHASVVQPRDAQRIQDLGVVISYQHSFATSDQHFAESALGPQRIKNVYTWRTLWDQGVTLAGGSDFPIEALPPLWGLQRVVTRQELDGTPSGGWFPDQRLTVEQALTSVTRNAAYDVFFENQTGSIQTGLLADFVVFERDLLSIEPSRIASVCVDLTVVGGIVVYDRGVNDLCSRFAYKGTLPRRSPDAAERIEERLRAENLGLVPP